MSELIRINITGKNSEPVSDADFYILDNNKTLREEELTFINTNKETIVKLFLEKVQEKIRKHKLIVNNGSSYSKKNQRYEIWIPDYYGKSYFGSIVGVVEDSLVIPDDVSMLHNSIDVPVEKQKLQLQMKLQIQSRFDSEKPYFLASMLLRDKMRLTDSTVPGSEDDLYDYMLLFWYKNRIREAYRKGFYKTYRRFEANDDHLKGTIDISRHIRLNAGQNNGRIAYSYRENTTNNYLNHMIVAAYDYLKKKYPELVEQNFDQDIELKNIVENLRYEIGYDAIKSRELITKNNKVIAHPYYTEYEDLRLLCIMILRDEGISIWNAEDETTKSILFYIPDLWELYLEDKIHEKMKTAVFYTQGQTPDGRDGIEVFGNLEHTTFSKKTYPDFIFFEKERPYFILDAKFKKGWMSSLAEKRGTEKLENLEDYDKCIRDMNSINANATGILYPTNEAPEQGKEYFTEASISHSISRYNQTDIFYTFPISIPIVSESTEKYCEWKRVFDHNVDTAMMVMEEKVMIEKKYAEKMQEFYKNLPKRESCAI